MSVDVAIIGAGISGLSLGDQLIRNGYRVRILERQVSGGGKAQSERIGGFLMEHGPSSITAGRPQMDDLEARLSLVDQRLILGGGVKRRYLVKEGGLKGISTSPLGFVTSNYLSIAGRLRLMLEPLIKQRVPGQEPESIGDFARRRFGKEFCDKVMDPLIAGIYASDCDQASINALFPKLAEMETVHGSIAKAIFAARRAKGKMPGRLLYSWQDGIGTLVDRLSERLRGHISLETTVLKISPKRKGGYRLDLGGKGYLDCAAVVLATPVHVSAGLLEGLRPDLAGRLYQVAAPAMANVFMGFHRSQIDHPLDGLGFLASRVENPLINGVQFCSTMFPGRAPADHVALSVYFGGARRADLACLPPADLIEIARAECAHLLGIKGAPVVAKVRHWHGGLPHYDLDHQGLVEQLTLTQQTQPGLFLCGNYINGPSISACVEQAGHCAGQIMVYLGCAGRGNEPDQLSEFGKSDPSGQSHHY